ncbi:Putative malate transporter YflS [Candidatus Arsenophonus lipoptenae]|uniref:Putative malate transporter YflS n=1 Tax=Candidatus Arsenophonus lipoptenae TaxID=634113 RepID=A0A0X9W6J3_9GAMM|nr:DASS family sodium-coupled anion symporter [Candidatus Arsenophonus lipoptenae]AMA64882.1 Putative malate transporter YflS [Candidatus Arsenophonus lipoptenae]
MNKLNPLKLLPAIIAIMVTLIIWFAIPAPKGIAVNAWQLLAIFSGTIVAIIGKALPIGAISIISITLVAVTKVTNPNNPVEAVNDALSGFSNQLIWLIGISIMISVSLSKTGLGTRIGYYFISLFGKKTLGIAYSLAIAETILAPVTPSNTARGGGIIHPLMRSIATSFGSDPTLGSSQRIGCYLSLVNFNINPITSAMFITATAPNPLIVNLIMENIKPPFEISWGIWAIAAFVPGIISLLVMPLIIYWIYPPEIKRTPDAPIFAKQKLHTLGKISSEEKITLLVFFVLLLMWADVPGMIFGSYFSVNLTVAAFIGLSILLCANILDWNDVLKTRGAWDTITWFAALVMMASFLSKLGLTNWFSKTVGNAINYAGISWIWGTLLLILVYVYSHYFFASTTAHIMAMFSAFFNVGLELGAPPILFGLILAFSSSLMMSLTHYSTGTAPIIFGSGYVALSKWWKIGFILSITNLSIWILIGSLWWKVLGYW